MRLPIVAICHILGSCLSEFCWDTARWKHHKWLLSLLGHCYFSCVHLCVSVCVRVQLMRCPEICSVNRPPVLLLLQPAAKLPSLLVVGDGECSECNKCLLAQLIFYPWQKQAGSAEESVLCSKEQYSRLLVVLGERFSWVQQQMKKESVLPKKFFLFARNRFV